MAATGAAAASSTQYVYGAHDFAAENEDELSFRMGERIRVIERDDQYQDGWWQGENERGQRGLFPQNYTTFNPPALSLPASPHTPSTGTFAASQQQQQQPSTAANGLLQPDLGNVGRKGSEGGQSQMRATLDDIQNHLDELTVSKGGTTDGTVGGSTTSERSPLGPQQQQHLGEDAAHGANGFQQSTQPPMKLERGMSIDETSSLASHSTRDDASLLDQEGDYSPAAGASGTGKQHQQHSRESTATATGGNYAKDNLARNIQLAQEKEQRRRLAEEQEREQERERMRLSGGPPVEGLVLTDESDIEEGGSDDDDSIFPSRKRGSGIEYGQANGGEDKEEQDRSPSPVQQQATVDAVPSMQSQSAATPPALTPAHADDQGDESNYPSPPPETANIVQTAVPPAALASVLASEQTSADRQQDVPSGEAQPAQDAHTFDMPGGLHTPSLEPAYQEQQPEAQASAQAGAPMQAPEKLKPSPEIQQGPGKPASKEASASHTPELDERDDFVVPKRDTPVEMPSREASPVSASFPSNAQQAGRVRTTSRYSADPAYPGQDNLLTIVEQASTGQSPDVGSPTTFSGPRPAGNSMRQSTASNQSGTAGPASSGQSVAGDLSRPSSTLGSAFTPATSMPYNHSPRSATFPVKTAGLADPKEWTVDQVVEWGQSKNLDAQVLSKFREHEISGDVLVEMDINTLKEIDILAFGTRARIAKGIKELNAKYYGVPMLSPATSYATDLPTTPESYSAPQSLQTNFYGTSSVPGQSPVTPAQSYPSSPATAQATPVSATSFGTRGLGLAGQSAGGLPEATSRSSKSSMPRSSTARSRNASGEADDSFGDSNAVQEELDDRALTPKEQAGEGVPPSATSERRRQKSSLGSNVSSVFGRAHGRQKSMTPSIADSNTGSVDTADKAASKTGGKSFFGGTLSRNRKPAPTYQAGEGDSVASQEKTERPAPVLRSPSASAPPGNRLSSRFFAFGGGSSAPTSPEMQNERAKRNISAPLEATSPPAASNATSFESSRSPVTSPTATVSRNQEPSLYVAGGQKQPQQQQEEAMPMAPPAKPMTQAERIGSPDHCGWLRKKADRYNAWKDRYLILKDGYLYVLKTPQEEKVKGYINLAGYKFISDGSVGSGLSEKSKYGFKAIHDTLPTHYFSSSDSLTIRNWMKALMKVTIGRDYSAPVTSSSNIKTIPLSVAQAMNPPPRPPSPTSAIRVQKASVKQNPNSLSPQDAAKLMGAQTITPSPSGMVRSGSQNGLSNEKQGSPVSPSKRKVGGILPPLRSSQRKKPISESASMTRSASATRPGLVDDNRRSSFYEKYSDRQQKAAPRDSISSSVMTQQPAQDSYSGDITPPAQQPSSGAQHELIDWFNSHLPTSVTPAHSWQDFCSGKLYTRVVENMSGRPSGIDDGQFAKFKPLHPGRTPDMDYLDVLFGCFDYLLDSGVKTEDVSINDLLSGNEPHLIKLAEIIRNKYEP